MSQRVRAAHTALPEDLSAIPSVHCWGGGTPRPVILLPGGLTPPASLDTFTRVHVPPHRHVHMTEMKSFKERKEEN